MSKLEPTTSTPYGTWVVRVWLAALIIFLICLGWTVASDSPSRKKSEAGPPLPVAGDDRGTVLENLLKPGMARAPNPPFDADREYVLVGAGVQGFYQSSEPDKVWTLAYPAPQFSVQLIRRGPDFPEVVAQGVKITWELDPQVRLTDSAAARQGRMKSVDDAYFLDSIPVSAIRSDGALNPYPVVKLRAEEEATGEPLAESAFVLAVAPGFGCYHCHENAGAAILEVHDRHLDTRLGERNAKGEVIACRSCHTELPPDQASDQANAGQKENRRALSLSAAVHGWHAVYLPDKGASACMTCHVAQGRAGGEEKSPPQPVFARDFHVDRGLNCTRRHGYLEDHALALLKAEQEYGQPQAAKAMSVITARAVQPDEIEARLPWVQEPDCAGCHNFTEKPDLLNASAFNKWTPIEDGLSGLFSGRLDDMASVRCLTCHGAPHAVYPARNPLADDLDNIPPIQYQEQAAPLGRYGNCALCHGQSMDAMAHHPQVDISRTSVRAPAGAGLSMPVARFSHQLHVRHVNCITCHHTGHEDGKSLFCASSGCHDSLEATLPAKENEDPRPNPRYFYHAFHGEFPSCLACHTQSLAAGKPAGPTDCGVCHQAPSARWAALENGRDTDRPD